MNVWVVTYSGYINEGFSILGVYDEAHKSRMLQEIRDLNEGERTVFTILEFEVNHQELIRAFDVKELVM